MVIIPFFTHTGYGKEIPRGCARNIFQGGSEQVFQWASPGKLFFHGTIFGIIHNIAFHIPVWVKNGIAQFDLLSPISGGGDSLIKAGRYGCAVSAKPRQGKISRKKQCLGKTVSKNLMTGQVFITFKMPKLKIFSN